MTNEEVWRAIEQLTEAVEQQNDELRLRNALLAVQVLNAERAHREQMMYETGRESNSYHWSRFASDVADALHTLENDIDQ